VSSHAVEVRGGSVDLIRDTLVCASNAVNQVSGGRVETPSESDEAPDLGVVGVQVVVIDLQLCGSINLFSGLKGDISETMKPREALDLAKALPRTTLPLGWVKLTGVSTFTQLKSTEIVLPLPPNRGDAGVGGPGPHIVVPLFYRKGNGKMPYCEYVVELCEIPPRVVCDEMQQRLWISGYSPWAEGRQN